MKLAISNIAWERDQEHILFPQFLKMGVSGIDIAPTKLWPQWEGASEKAAVDHARTLSTQGFQTPALQSLFFGKPDFQVCIPDTHSAFLDHVRLVADIAAGLGAKILVWGSPTNRQRGQLGNDEAQRVAVRFFSKAAEICAARNICIGIEPNPASYKCDFVTNVADGRLLVDQIQHQAFQLHLDAGGIHMCGGPIEETIERAGRFVHFHASEPDLNPLAGGVVDHRAAYKALQKINYSNWVSIEMKPPKNINVILASVELAAKAYNVAQS